MSFEECKDRVKEDYRATRSAQEAQSIINRIRDDAYAPWNAMPPNSEGIRPAPAIQANLSFADLAADRAGTRFGKLVADGSPRLEDFLRRTPTDADLVPSLGGLPEYLSEAEFARRYGGRGNPAYGQLMADIEGRLAALPLYR